MPSRRACLVLGIGLGYAASAITALGFRIVLELGLRRTTSKGA